MVKSIEIKHNRRGIYSSDGRQRKLSGCHFLQLLSRLWHCLYSMRTVNTSHAMIIKASAPSTVVPDGRDLGIFTHIGGMLDNKEFACSVPVNDTLSVSFLIRKGRI